MYSMAAAYIKRGPSYPTIPLAAMEIPQTVSGRGHHHRHS